jgi:hypothetical protein
MPAKNGLEDERVENIYTVDSTCIDVFIPILF